MSVAPGNEGADNNVLDGNELEDSSAVVVLEDKIHGFDSKQSAFLPATSRPRSRSSHLTGSFCGLAVGVFPVGKRC